MYTERGFCPVAVLILVSPAICAAQTVTSARSGTLHYFEGTVSIDGTSLTPKASKFPSIQERGVLRTGKGRAEILLTPGVFLRVGEDSAIRMVDTRLISTRVDIRSGSAVIESEDPQMAVKAFPVTLLFRDYEIQMVKYGLVEITSDPAQLKVFRGEAKVSTGGRRAVVRDGRLLSFALAFRAEKFDPRRGDDLYLWARDRSQNLSGANMSSGRSISQDSCFFVCANSVGVWNGGW
jgi:hypothetical protein